MDRESQREPKGKITRPCHKELITLSTQSRFYHDNYQIRGYTDIKKAIDMLDYNRTNIINERDYYAIDQLIKKEGYI